MIHHSSAMLLFIIIFDVNRMSVTDLVNDFAFWCRSYGQDRKDNAELDPEETALSTEDLATMRAFVGCQNPMFSAFESLLRKLNERARTGFVEKMGLVMGSSVSVVRKLAENHHPTLSVDLGAEKEEKKAGPQDERDAYLAVLAAAMIVTDRIMHSLHDCPLHEGHTGGTASKKDCKRGILSLQHPHVSVAECVSLIATQCSGTTKEALVAMLTFSMRTPVAQMEEFLRIYAPN